MKNTTDLRVDAEKPDVSAPEGRRWQRNIALSRQRRIDLKVAQHFFASLRTHQEVVGGVRKGR